MEPHLVTVKRGILASIAGGLSPSPIGEACSWGPGCAIEGNREVAVAVAVVVLPFGGGFLFKFEKSLNFDPSWWLVCHLMWLACNKVVWALITIIFYFRIRENIFNRAFHEKGKKKILYDLMKNSSIIIKKMRNVLIIIKLPL